MKSIPRKITIAERAGRSVGRVWRRLRHQEMRAMSWLAQRGMPAWGAKAVLWSVKLLALGIALYAGFWLVLIIAFVIFALAHAGDVSFANREEEDEWAIGQQEDHTQNPFYDPLDHCDPPDPRFDGEYDDDAR